MTSYNFLLQTIFARLTVSELQLFEKGNFCDLPKYIRPFLKSVLSQIDLSTRGKLMIYYTENVCKVLSKSENVISDDLLSFSGIPRKLQVGRTGRTADRGIHSSREKQQFVLETVQTFRQSGS